MIAALQIKTFMIYNLVFINNTILSFFFLLVFLIIDLQFLINAVTAQISNPNEELTIPIGIPINEAKA